MEHRDLYKKNGLLPVKISEKRDDCLRNRKNKRSEAFDVLRPKIIESEVNLKPKQQRIERFQKENFYKGYKGKKKPFIVGVVRHKIHSPPFLHESVNHTESKKRYPFTAIQSFAPSNYKFHPPKGLKLDVLTPKTQSSPFTLRSLLCKQEEYNTKKKESRFANVNVGHRLRKLSFGSPISTTPKTKQVEEINKDRCKHIAKQLWSETSDEPPAFGRLNMLNAFKASTPSTLEDDLAKETNFSLPKKNEIISSPNNFYQNKLSDSTCRNNDKEINCAKWTTHKVSYTNCGNSLLHTSITMQKYVETIQCSPLLEKTKYAKSFSNAENESSYNSTTTLCETVLETNSTLNLLQTKRLHKTIHLNDVKNVFPTLPVIVNSSLDSVNTENEAMAEIELGKEIIESEQKTMCFNKNLNKENDNLNFDVDALNIAKNTPLDNSQGQNELADLEESISEETTGELLANILHQRNIDSTSTTVEECLQPEASATVVGNLNNNVSTEMNKSIEIGNNVSANVETEIQGIDLEESRNEKITDKLDKFINNSIKHKNNNSNLDEVDALNIAKNSSLDISQAPNEFTDLEESRIVATTRQIVVNNLQLQKNDFTEHLYPKESNSLTNALNRPLRDSNSQNEDTGLKLLNAKEDIAKQPIKITNVTPSKSLLNTPKYLIKISSPSGTEKLCTMEKSFFIKNANEGSKTEILIKQPEIITLSDSPDIEKKKRLNNEIIDLVSDDEEDCTAFYKKLLAKYSSPSMFTMTSIEHIPKLHISSCKTPRSHLVSKEDSPSNSPIRVLSLRNRQVDVTPSPKKLTPRIKFSHISPCKTPKSHLVSKEDSPSNSPIRVLSLRNRQVDITPSPKKLTPRGRKKKDNQRI